MSENQNSLSNWYKVLLGLSIAFVILLIFGISCTVSGYVSTSAGFRSSVFGMCVMEVRDDSSETYPFASKVLVHNATIEDVEVGDFVVFGSLNYFLNSNNFGEVTSIDGNDVTITTEKDGNTQIINADSIAGILGTTNPAACGFVEFILSGWTLWLFVIIPCVALIAIILLWLWHKLSLSEAGNQKLADAETKSDSNEKIEDNSIDNSAQTSEALDSASNEKIEADKSSKEAEVISENKTSSKKKKAKNIEQTTENAQTEDKAQIEEKAEAEQPLKNDATEQASKNDEASEVEGQKEEKKKSKKSIKADDNYLLLAEPKKEDKIPRLKKVPIAPPKAKRQGDDYVFRKQPTTDTNTPIKEMLEKITNDSGNKDKQDLLDKMKKQ